MEASESVLRAGYRLDRYELLCPIATGGMATVWLARLRGKRGFEKLFAVKTIRTELVEDPRFQEMFLDEARIASGIQHPNVAQILDLGEQEDVLFIVMEWVDGDSLAKLRRLLAKRDTRLPVSLVLRILADACAGLHAAHELRDEHGEALEIVHRDVSPHNILLSSAGAVKVIDFGIAKAQNRRQGQTRTGIVKGKIQYMSPEQVTKGATVDRRADIWALAMCLHELVLGRLPYEGDDDVEVIRRLMTQQAPTIAPELPGPIARILERALALDPDDRFPTAAGMQRALEAAMAELGAATSEDVAAFLRTELPELASKRREAVARAIDEARERGAPIVGESGDDVAFAPTLVGKRDGVDPPSEEPRALALIRRKDVRAPEPTPPATTPSDDPPASASSRLIEEPITIPKRSRAWLWTSLVLTAAAIGAAAAWPQLQGVVHGTLGPAVSPAPVPPVPETPPSALVVVAPPPPAPAAAPAEPSATASAATPAETVIDAGTSSTAAGVRPSPSATVGAASGPEPPGSARHHLGWPSSVLAASARAPAPPLPGLPAPSASATAAPAPTDDDPTNPYNDPDQR